MAVYDIAAGQRLSRPVSAMYEGKALRAGIKEAELQNEELEASIKAGLPERRVEVSERQVGAMEAQNERLEGQDATEQEQYMAEQQVRASMSGVAAYEGLEGTPEEKQQAGYEGYISYIDSVVPGGREEAEAYLAENGMTGADAFNYEEAKSVIVPFLEQDETGSSMIERMISRLPEEEQGPMLRRWLEKEVAIDEPREPKVTPPATPTRAEEEIVAEVTEPVFEDDQYDDYGFSGDEQSRIQRWVGGQAEVIQKFEAQRNRLVSFEQAARIAAEEAKLFIEPPMETGIFSNDSYEFKAPMYNRGDRIEGSDGKIYLVTGYNEQGGPVGEPIN